MTSSMDAATRAALEGSRSLKMTMILTYRYRLLPSARQHAALAAILESQRQLYNAALEERVGAYRATGRGRTYFDQAKALTICRRDLPEMAALPANLQRWTLKRLDDAYAGFFRRVKARGVAGFPRFRSKGRWDSLGFAEFCGIRWDGKRLRFSGMPGGLRVHLHRPLPADIRSCVFRRDGSGWYVCFQVRVAAAAKRVVSRPIGLDLGLTALAHLSDGVIIPNPRVALRTERLMRLRSRALARCRRGSKRRAKVRARLARAHRKIMQTRRTYLHQQSAMLARNYDLIAVEDLRTANLLRNEHLARAISDASWRTFIDMLAYKVEGTGGHLVKVDARLTSQACSRCGVIVRKGLAERVHACPECGLTLDRDHNAALNILHRGVVAARAQNVGQWPVRAPGKLREILN